MGGWPVQAGGVTRNRTGEPPGTSPVEVSRTVTLAVSAPCAGADGVARGGRGRRGCRGHGAGDWVLAGVAAAVSDAVLALGVLADEQPLTVASAAMASAAGTATRPRAPVSRGRRRMTWRRFSCSGPLPDAAYDSDRGHGGQPRQQLFCLGFREVFRAGPHCIQTILKSIVWDVTGSHDARERLIAAAEGLLTRSGPRSVSMDAAAAAAGAGKMSAYRHFASKEDLIAAALEHHDPRHVRWLVGPGKAAGPGANAGAGHAAEPVAAAGPGAEPAEADPAQRLLSAFDRLEAAAASEPFRGCPFVDAALGAPATDDRTGRIAWRHKEHVVGALARLAAQAGLPEPEELAAAVALIIDGAAAHAALAPDAASRRRIVRRGRRAAEALLASAGQS